MVRTTLTLYVDSEELEEAKKRRMNISEFFRECLKKELEISKQKEQKL